MDKIIYLIIFSIIFIINSENLSASELIMIDQNFQLTDINCLDLKNKKETNECIFILQNKNNNYLNLIFLIKNKQIIKSDNYINDLYFNLKSSNKNNNNYNKYFIDNHALIGSEYICNIQLKPKESVEIKLHINKIRHYSFKIISTELYKNSERNKFIIYGGFLCFQIFIIMLSFILFIILKEKISLMTFFLLIIHFFYQISMNALNINFLNISESIYNNIKLSYFFISLFYFSLFMYLNEIIFEKIKVKIFEYIFILLFLLTSLYMVNIDNLNIYMYLSFFLSFFMVSILIIYKIKQLKASEINLIIILFLYCTSLINSIFSIIYYKDILFNLNSYYDYMFYIIGSIDSLVFFIFILVNLKKKRDKFLYKLRKLKKISKKTRIYALKQQLKPHFLFNLLNSVYYSINENIEVSKNIILEMSNFFREMLLISKKTIISLEEEMNLVNKYILFEKIRFKEKILFIKYIEKDLDLKKILIPPLSIYIIIENSIKYGSNNSKKVNTVELHITKIGKNFIKIEIMNDFVEDNKKNTIGSKSGLKNLDERLKIIYGEKSQVYFCIDKKNNKAITWFCVGN
jgi:sensor histidine kinase YesM